MPIANGFLVFHSNQLEHLSELLIESVKQHPLKPLDSEVILVQSNGMKHWLEIQIAKDSALGICAATTIDLPSTLIWRMYRAVLGEEKVPAHMPLDKSNLVWRLLRFLHSQEIKKDTYSPLHAYLNPQPDTQNTQYKAYQLAMQLADVLDGYQNYRADWLQNWSNGSYRIPLADGQSVAMPDEHLWQTHLWQWLMQDLATQDQWGASMSSRASVHTAFMQAIQSFTPTNRPSQVPSRVMVFGISSLPLQSVEALAALGQITQVLMFVTNPCQVYWQDVVEDKRLMHHWIQSQAKQSIPKAISTNDLHIDTHPLLAAWGQQARDYLHLIDCFEVAGQQARQELFADPWDPSDSATHHQLQMLQSDILNLRSNQHFATLNRQRNDDDKSITWVSCYSAQREVEVLHDQILQWLNLDPNLSLRQIMVMVPDIQSFAPHIQAAWGRFDTSDPRYIPFHIADPTPSDHPMVQALELLLQLPTLRFTPNDWLSLLDVDAIREKLELSVHDVESLHEWIRSSAIRWGINPLHRQSMGLPDINDGDHNTWEFGVRRMLLGYATGAANNQEAWSQTWHNTVPTPDIGGINAWRIGQLIVLLDAITQTRQSLMHAQTPKQWLVTLQALMQKFFLNKKDEYVWVSQKLSNALEKWVQQCEWGQFNEAMHISVVRDHWLNSIELPAMHQRFLGDGVQFATLMPMRSIPFQRVCLLGMNYGAYPRPSTPRDFDLLTHAPWRRLADRSRREDDRYLFLEALLSARERLYISWQSRHPSDHEKLPPSVLISQLMDYLNQIWPHSAVATEYPLQAFSNQYITPHSRFQTFSHEWITARATQENVDTRDEHLSVAAPQALQVHHLRQLLRQPLDIYYQHHLQIRMEQPQELDDSDEPFLLNGLQKYQLISLLMHPHSNDSQALQHAGVLPLSGFGQVMEQQLKDEVIQLKSNAQSWLEEIPIQNIDAPTTNIQWDDDKSVTGVLQSGQWFDRGNQHLLHLDYSATSIFKGDPLKKTTLQACRIKLHQLVGLWVEHLCACASG
ncbi:MAG: exodeoxyribonuclease V subunit gamma, partial [Limnohabitans sp.]|nr:exodeoxyribonuclease V subunit gamma [Limnohabitans sp.]